MITRQIGTLASRAPISTEETPEDWTAARRRTSERSHNNRRNL